MLNNQPSALLFISQNQASATQRTCCTALHPLEQGQTSDREWCALYQAFTLFQSYLETDGTAIIGLIVAPDKR